MAAEIMKANSMFEVSPHRGHMRDLLLFSHLSVGATALWAVSVLVSIGAFSSWQGALTHSGSLMLALLALAVAGWQLVRVPVTIRFATQTGANLMGTFGVAFLLAAGVLATCQGITIVHARLMGGLGTTLQVNHLSVGAVLASFNGATHATLLFLTGTAACWLANFLPGKRKLVAVPHGKVLWLAVLGAAGLYANLNPGLTASRSSDLGLLKLLVPLAIALYAVLAVLRTAGRGGAALRSMGLAAHGFFAPFAFVLVAGAACMVSLRYFEIGELHSVYRTVLLIGVGNIAAAGAAIALTAAACSLYQSFRTRGVAP